MENKNQPISPCLIKGRQGFADMPTIPNREFHGLTKREYFAGLAMQAIVSREVPKDADRVVSAAVGYADLLLQELEKPEQI